MRLLHKSTLEFKDFASDEVPNYYTLSHCWEGDETTLQSFEAERDVDINLCSPGNRKVRQLCQEVCRSIYPAEYVWADTCCIDKTSSSELQEAINSMYKWYERSEVCFVHLSDVSYRDENGVRDGSKPISRKISKKITESRWFTRGWTLQELVAPRELIFFDRDWNRLMHRDSMRDELEERTGIWGQCFGSRAAILNLTIAERLSWMASRNCRRVEDRSYCLLGLMDVSMPLLYGEGEKAFLRLQREIVQFNEDETIFAWRIPANKFKPEWKRPEWGLFAPQPECFAETRKGRIMPHFYFPREPWRMTNRGLEIETLRPKTRSTNTMPPTLIELPLNCSWRKDGSSELEKISLLLAVRSNGRKYRRANVGRFMSSEERNELNTKEPSRRFSPSLDEGFFNFKQEREPRMKVYI